MSDPVNTDTEPDADPDEMVTLPVEVDLETPEADLLEQGIPVVLDVEGYGPR